MLGADSADDFAETSLLFVQMVPPSFVPNRTIQGAPQNIQMSDMTPGMRITFTKSTSCQNVAGAATSIKTEDYLSGNNNPVFQLLSSATAGNYHICVQPNGEKRPDRLVLVMLKSDCERVILFRVVRACRWDIHVCARSHSLHHRPSDIHAASGIRLCAKSDFFRGDIRRRYVSFTLVCFVSLLVLLHSIRVLELFGSRFLL